MELPREQGKVKTLKQDYGFIECCEREEDLFVHFSEVMPDEAGRGDKGLRVGDEVEFSIADTIKGRKGAIEVRIVPKGTVEFEVRDPANAGRLEGKISRVSRNGGALQSGSGFVEAYASMLTHRAAEASNGIDGGERTASIEFINNDLEWDNADRKLHGSLRVGDTMLFSVR